MKNKLLFLVVAWCLLAGLASADVWFTNNTDFTGTYYQTWLNGSFIQLNLSYSDGYYTSPIFDASVTQNWSNVSWVGGLSYGEAGSGLSGNELLFHLNNQSEFGEDTGINGTVYDFSGNGNNGTLRDGGEGEPQFTTDGRFNGAFVFNGAADNTGSYIVVENKSFFDSDDMQVYTLSAWINLSDVPDTGGGCIFHRTGGSGENELKVEIEDDGAITFSTGDNDLETSAGVVSPNVWHHIVASISADNIKKIYVDGTKITNVSDATTFEYHGNFYIGVDLNAVDSTFGEFFDGIIDEVVVFNRNLSEEEVADLYIAGLLRLNITVRSCDDALCSSDAWNETYSSSPQNLTVAPNRLFQYNMSFATHNQSYTPEFWNVSFGFVDGITLEDCLNITIYYVSAAGLPIGNLVVTLRNTSNNNTVATNTTDNTTGRVTFYNVDSVKYPPTGVNFLSEYPSSAYTSQLTNVSCDSEVYLNDFGSISVIVTNTLGEYLEGQDGNVFVSEADDPDKRVKTYDTQCTDEEIFLDEQGNYASVFKCPFSDSRGNYVYVFDVNAEDGYFFNTEYVVHAVINGQESTCNFNVTNPRRTDVDLVESESKRWSGIIVAFLGLLILAVLFIALLIKIIRRGFKQ